MPWHRPTCFSIESLAFFWKPRVARSSRQEFVGQGMSALQLSLNEETFVQLKATIEFYRLLLQVEKELNASREREITLLNAASAKMQERISSLEQQLRCNETSSIVSMESNSTTTKLQDLQSGDVQPGTVSHST